MQFAKVVVEHERRIQPGLGVEEGTGDLHYYAMKNTAPGGYKLNLEVSSEHFVFAKPVFPKWEIFSDPLGKDVEVYAGNFTVFIPIEEVKAEDKEKGDEKKAEEKNVTENQPE